MIVGLGIGLIVDYFVKVLGERVFLGLLVYGVVMFLIIEVFVKQCDIFMLVIDDIEWIDVMVDGVDEVDCEFRLIKGGGGVFLCEKIVVDVLDWMVVIVDEGKLVFQLGEFLLFVEIV